MLFLIRNKNILVKCQGKTLEANNIMLYMIRYKSGLDQSVKLIILLIVNFILRQEVQLSPSYGTTSSARQKQSHIRSGGLSSREETSWLEEVKRGIL